jgi:uncharacterized membrane protein
MSEAKVSPENLPRTLAKQDRTIIRLVYVLYLFGPFTTFLSAGIGFLIATFYRSKARSSSGALELALQRSIFTKAVLGSVVGFAFSFFTLALIDQFALPKSVEPLMYLGVAVTGFSILWFLYKSISGIRNASRGLNQPHTVEEEGEYKSAPSCSEEHQADKEDITVHADRLLALIESFYEFGDPTFEPGQIYVRAEAESSYTPSEVDELIENLSQRGLVELEYRPGPSSHPAEEYDYWRLLKPSAEPVTQPSGEALDGTATLGQLSEYPNKLLGPLIGCLRKYPQVMAGYYLVMQDKSGDSFIIGILAKAGATQVVKAAQEVADKNTFSDNPILVIAIDPNKSDPVTAYFREAEPFYFRD